MISGDIQGPAANRYLAFSAQLCADRRGDQELRPSGRRPYSRGADRTLPSHRAKSRDSAATVELPLVRGHRHGARRAAA